MKAWNWSAGLLILIASSGAVAGAPSAPADYDTEARRHYDARVAEFAQRVAPTGATAFLGDSLTEWADWEKLFPAIATANFGIAMDRTTGVLARIAQVRAAKPSKVVVLIGTNDLGGGRPPAETVASVERIVIALKGFMPAERILVLAVPPRAGGYQYLNPAIEEYNRQLKTIVAGEGAEFIDSFTPFLTGGEMDSKATADGLHFSEAGYRRLAQLIAGWVMGD